MTAAQVAEKAARYKEYFGKTGGITLSGGEPLMQAEFATEIFRLCRASGIHTCLDTSGSILTDKTKALLQETDRVLLDIKYTREEDYLRYAGCSMEAPLAFLHYLNGQKIPTTLRQVIIPTLNDSADNVRALKSLADTHPCVDTVELLPFRKMCQVKYDSLHLPFPFSHLPEPTKETMQMLNTILNQEGGSL